MKKNDIKIIENIFNQEASITENDSIIYVYLYFSHSGLFSLSFCKIKNDFGIYTTKTLNKEEAIKYQQYLDIFIKNYDVLYKIFLEYSNKK